MRFDLKGVRMSPARSLIVLAALAAFPAAAQATTCEEGFVKKGAVIGGLKFTASVTVSDLAPPTAIYQVKGLALSRGYDVLTEEANEGSMLIEQPRTENTRPFPIIVSAVQEGRSTVVTLQANLRGGMIVKEDAARSEMCSLLNQVKGGKAGIAAASRGKTAVAVASPPEKITAQSLSGRLSREKDRNEEAIPLRYKGKSFIISGEVDYVKKDGDQYRVAFKILEPYEMAIQLPGQADFKTDISCLMAKGQSAFALTLKPRKNVKLQGIYYNYRGYPPIMWLDNCRPVG